MRFLCLYKPADVAKAEQGGPPSPAEMEKMGKYIEEQMKSGALLATEGCAPTRLGAKVRLDKGKVTVTDGPFAEAKEVVAGLAIIQAKSKAEAILGAQDFMKFAGDGEVEIRQLHERVDGECPTEGPTVSAGKSNF
ncbi:YciI family protein [Edaphobacter bradus]|uniref:YciI family protein n=1 Tax=Edaphobacter bradus TaxID=2259016 RepID=UPI0021E04D84|nr:YciI family protein [Edaphobacter bradus]